MNEVVRACFYCWYEHFCHESGDKQFIGHSSFNLLIWLFACQEIPSSSAEYFHQDFLHQWDEKSSETDCKRTGQKNPPLHAKIITINHSNVEWWRILLFSFFFTASIILAARERYSSKCKSALTVLTKLPQVIGAWLRCVPCGNVQ